MDPSEPSMGPGVPHDASQDIVEHRKQMEEELKKVEQKIFELETQYLEETASFGNVLRGWDVRGTDAKAKPKARVNQADRWFSLSSVTSPASTNTGQVQEDPMDPETQALGPPGMVAAAGGAGGNAQDGAAGGVQGGAPAASLSVTGTGGRKKGPPGKKG
uniref:Chromatin modification-related protein MEAF6 n=1 Tax=Chromera velia CCMP2878 TaxID=1169474 RepID=A0A0G4H9D3_9ALVE|mmetsp:Transcript_727/g.1635  ORF Transcript_727/g.1635 Transcript_727/m.1635 type:complete len:160 (-) Transcript_727:322-801(-)|eukprot:Cvel_5911.t1-p1 / transcript=Cvel_5911.t1 / gene=Cvel_5911 / organism=Chromera_velia_CCMP2878 / gene_product=Chromatin modification-related protein eaf6, putative / transcript_product=Chromatin modification-related protein eaf6, putative / location=Cvel_scaffold282:40260-42376(-) / protein_length=159 / sequence_SO=supercontig / SO=protein_coding / is_pseudo=false